MGLNDQIKEIQATYTTDGRFLFPQTFSGVTKEKVKRVLGRIDRATIDMVDVVFALLDGVNPSFFPKAARNLKFRDGATVAHIGCHVGMLQRGGTKLDREGRDYWLKPLWELGAVEKIHFLSKNKSFVPGHPVAKSPNNAYRLASEFAAILALEGGWEAAIESWISKDRQRVRLKMQAEMAEQTTGEISSKHQELIRSCVNVFAKHFLPDYRVIYVDDSDGDRISENDKKILLDAGIELGLDDAMPDVLLCNESQKALWVVEAVTSDGEVDLHKVEQLTRLAKRCGYEHIAFTTAYPSWKVAATRQGKHKNIAPGTFIWIAEDPSKHLELHFG